MAAKAGNQEEPWTAVEKLQERTGVVHRGRGSHSRRFRGCLGRGGFAQQTGLDAGGDVGRGCGVAACSAECDDEKDWHEGGVHHRRHRVLAAKTALSPWSSSTPAVVTIAFAISAAEASSLLYSPAWAQTSVCRVFPTFKTCLTCCPAPSAQPLRPTSICTPFRDRRLPWLGISHTRPLISSLSTCLIFRLFSPICRDNT